VSRWPLTTAVPGSPSGALPSLWPGPNARVRPLAPDSTIHAAPSRGIASRATGQVSAQGHGRTLSSPSFVCCQARSSSTWASRAFAWIHTPAASWAPPPTTSAAGSAAASARRTALPPLTTAPAAATPFRR